MQRWSWNHKEFHGLVRPAGTTKSASHQVWWWPVPWFPGLERKRESQGSLWVWGQSGQQGEFEDSQGCNAEIKESNTGYDSKKKQYSSKWFNEIVKGFYKILRKEIEGIHKMEKQKIIKALKSPYYWKQYIDSIYWIYSIPVKIWMIDWEHSWIERVFA